jgi:hypothetical protein
MSAPASEHPFVLVSFDPDWEALYVEGTKVAEGHHVEKKQLVSFGQNLALQEKRHVELKESWVEESDGNEHGEYDIPDELGGFSEIILGRIS